MTNVIIGLGIGIASSVALALMWLMFEVCRVQLGGERDELDPSGREPAHEEV